VKIAIIGSRGIPNNYGGFEQFAEYLSRSLVAKGHQVWVCNPHYHSYKKTDFQGVNIKHIFNPETIIGTPGNFVYDFLCLRFSVKIKPDIIFMLGYTTSSVWFRFFRFRNTVLVTNLDGLEWKRDKWGTVVKKMTRWFEYLAVKYGGHLVADHPVIRDYFQEHHHAKTTYIPYGADQFTNPDEQVLKEFHLEKNRYNLLIARFEAEHNIEMIIDGHLKSGRQELLVLVGNYSTPYGEMLKKKYRDISKLRFLGGIYNINKLNNLRYFSNVYFHGHSIGGTNPSLLEAMASGALIVAHNNPFNKSILGDNALYFSTAGEISRVLETINKQDPSNQQKIENNCRRIAEDFNWKNITDDYEDLFNGLIHPGSSPESRQQSHFNQTHGGN
jgi:glycosyltransferase involved in cell wall biosynthesis